MSDFSFSFSVFGNRYIFTPKFTLVIFSILFVLLGLGIWQWQSAESIDDTVDMVKKRITLEPIQLNDINKKGDWRYYPIRIKGVFDSHHQILISNRMYKGRRGYQVLTPFKPADSLNEILVNRGWIPEFPAGKTPNLNTISTEVTILGILFHPPHTILGRAFDESKVTWPLISKTPDIEKIANVLNAKMYPFIVLLSPSSQYGFVREWLWLITTIEPDRHLAYAKQWFVLAITVLLMFIFMNIHRMD